MMNLEGQDPSMGQMPKLDVVVAALFPRGSACMIQVQHGIDFESFNTTFKLSGSMEAAAGRLGGRNGTDDREEALPSEIQQLIDESDGEGGEIHSHPDRALLSRLLSQVERSKEDDIEEYQRPSEEMGSMNCSNKKSDDVGATATKDEGAAGVTAQELVEELRKVRRQNTITHMLLSVLIVVTAVWQFSEFSFILEIKNQVQHPFRAVGGMIIRALGGNPDRSSQDKSSSPVIPRMDGHPHPLPPFKMPELPHVELKPLPGNSGS